ncbi:MAG: hypothetical protein EBX39_13260, partial [Actinobacteria bacterium]|nr:hypothetical protein [Actinomycetota bacterium]
MPRRVARSHRQRPPRRSRTVVQRGTGDRPRPRLRLRRTADGPRSVGPTRRAPGHRHTDRPARPDRHHARGRRPCRVH